MKNNLQNLRFFSVFFLIFALFFINSKLAFCQTFPSKPASKLVSDFAKIYSATENEILEQRLVAYEKETSTQIAIVTLTTLNGYPIDDYAVKLANQWKIGQKEKNNGLLILIASADHKIYIASGYGMEGSLNDGKLGSIIRNQIIPHFKNNNNYFAGTQAGLDAIISAAAGEYVNDDKNEDESFFSQAFKFMLFILVGMFLFGRSFIFTSPMLYIGGKGGSGGGGGFGGFGGGSFGGGGAGGSW